MKYLYIFVLILVVTLGFQNCIKDAEISPKDYPYLLLDEPVLFDKGVKINAEIKSIGNQDITGYGFVWDENKDPLLNKSNQSIQNGSPSQNSFNTTISTGLIDNQRYYIRAVIITDKNILYSNEKKFISNGSLTPKLVSFLPTAGYDNTPVTFIFENLGFFKTDINIFLDNVELQIVQRKTDTIIANIPHNTLIGNYSFKFTYGNSYLEPENKFTILGPLIDNISPLTGTTGIIIKISGKSFITNDGKSEIFFKEKRAQTINVSDSLIICTVPRWLHENPIITIKNGSKRTYSQKPFILKHSWKEVSNFGGTSFKNRANATTFSINNKGYFSGGNTGVKELWRYDPGLDLWERLSDFPEGYAFDMAFGFSYNAKGYMITGRKTKNIGGSSYSVSITNEFWQYDPQQDKWIKLTDFKGGPRIKASGFVIGDYLYFGLGFNENRPLSDFWKYNFKTGVWKELDPFPGKVSLNKALAFSINSKGYIKEGASYNSGFWQFNPETEEWTPVAKLPSKSNVYGFSLNGKGYVGGGTSYSETWEYHPDLNKWIQKEDFPRCIDEVAHFVIGDKAYLGYGDCSGRVDLPYFYEFTP
ncbi:kelch repeat-containing protein [Saccharicrinis sp. FJH2]|uniref:kelch repeat-containing protein n=1 Tax=Saccharicrinis sp. FJH65 TaxID=3344659 RepID=UPI0035F44204